MNKKLFSILIPSWNNLDFLKLCVQSIQKNSSFQHQIIIHINEGNDGSLAWIKKQNIDYTFSEENIGICKALNLSAKLANCNYILYMNDDMYVLPDWDKYLKEEIDAIGNNHFYLSATLLEPKDTGNKSVIAPAYYGSDISSFNEKDLLKEYKKYAFKDWSGSSWPPSVVHKDMWKAVNGYSEEFSPGLYSDPDFSMKLWQKGVRYYKGVSKARVYHFQSKSLKRITLNNGRKQFYQKWGITASFFDKKYIRKGQVFENNLKNPNAFALFLNRLKVFVYRLKP